MDPWDMASIHASEATLAAMRATFPHVVLCFLPPQSTSYLQPCDVAVFRSFKSCIQAQASATLARSVLDGTSEGLAMNKPWRRQSSAEWAARAIADILAEGKVWSTGWRTWTFFYLEDVVTFNTPTFPRTDDANQGTRHPRNRNEKANTCGGADQLETTYLWFDTRRRGARLLSS